MVRIIKPKSSCLEKNRKSYTKSVTKLTSRGKVIKEYISQDSSLQLLCRANFLFKLIISVTKTNNKERGVRVSDTLLKSNTAHVVIKDDSPPSGSLKFRTFSYFTKLTNGTFRFRKQNKPQIGYIKINLPCIYTRAYLSLRLLRIVCPPSI